MAQEHITDRKQSISITPTASFTNTWVEQSFTTAIMFDTMSTVLRRDSLSPTAQTPSNLTIGLVVAFLVLVLTALTITGTFMYRNRRRRISRRSHIQLDDDEDALPTYDIEKRLTSISTKSSSVRKPASPSPSSLKLSEKLPSFSPSPPPSPIPEIRITFPEEIDEKGQRKSGCVVVVKVGEMGNVGGLEGTNDDGPPAYGFEVRGGQGQRWQSVDLERVGGLVEKARNAPSARME
jgi:hypothetical protein